VLVPASPDPGKKTLARDAARRKSLLSIASFIWMRFACGGFFKKISRERPFV
jgi:hypothetical protein